MKSGIFNIADFPLVRKSKYSNVEVKDVTNNTIYLEIDDVQLQVYKGDQGMPEINCTCLHCSNWGVNKNLFCRRKLRALWFLIHRDGRVSEIEKK